MKSMRRAERARSARLSRRGALGLGRGILVLLLLAAVIGTAFTVTLSVLEAPASRAIRSEAPLDSSVARIGGNEESDEGCKLESTQAPSPVHDTGPDRRPLDLPTLAEGAARLSIRVVNPDGSAVVEGNLLCVWAKHYLVESCPERFEIRLQIEGELTEVDLPFDAMGALVIAQRLDGAIGKGRIKDLRRHQGRWRGAQDSVHWVLVVEIDPDPPRVLAGAITVDGVSQVPEGLTIKLHQQPESAPETEDEFFRKSSQVAFVDHERCQYEVSPVFPYAEYLLIFSDETVPQTVGMKGIASEPGTLDLNLHSAGFLMLTVVDGDGVPCPGLAIKINHLYPEDEGVRGGRTGSFPRSFVTDAEGRIEVGGVASGHYVFVYCEEHDQRKKLWERRFGPDDPSTVEETIVYLGAGGGAILWGDAPMVSNDNALETLRIRHRMLEPGVVHSHEVAVDAEGRRWRFAATPGTHLVWGEDSSGLRHTEIATVEVVDRGDYGPIFLALRAERPVCLRWTGAPHQSRVLWKGVLGSGQNEAPEEIELQEPEGLAWIETSGLVSIEGSLESGSRTLTRWRWSEEEYEDGELFIDFCAYRLRRWEILINGETPIGPGNLTLIPLDPACTHLQTWAAQRTSAGQVDVRIPDSLDHFMYAYTDERHQAFICGLVTFDSPAAPNPWQDPVGEATVVHWFGDHIHLSVVCPEEGSWFRLEAIEDYPLGAILPEEARTWRREALVLATDSQTNTEVMVHLDLDRCEWIFSKDINQERKDR